MRASSEVRFVHANGIEIACTVQGSGPPLVLCHGGEADHRNFFNFAPLLARDFTVIAYDQRDSGDTRNGASPYTLADLGRDVGGLVEALNYGRADVFGTSWGGVIAQHAALECPNRVERLVLSATWPGGEQQVSDEFLEMVVAEKTPQQLRAYRQMFFSPGFARAFPEEVEARLGCVTSERTPEQRARRAPLAFAHDERARLPGLRMPVLVLCGAEDRIVSANFSRQLAALVPNARLELLDGVGHATTLEAPERVARIVRDFLKS